MPREPTSDIEIKYSFGTYMFLRYLSVLSFVDSGSTTNDLNSSDAADRYCDWTSAEDRNPPTNRVPSCCAVQTYPGSKAKHHLHVHTCKNYMFAGICLCATKSAKGSVNVLL